ncbi:GumC family protein [Fulvivirga ligni]|uniref:GumC family protein n=1 Tax=Fulvivirga ligni TaxID=2904246 RepID=UPI001F270C49|nr:hypothetical protein [Fulvivirga ligni]UII19188.1 hypothetical protein LVD16_15185 [Fulvivirga ligni]
MILLVPSVAAVVTFFLSRNAAKEYRSTAHISTGYTQDVGIKLTDERFNAMDAGTKFSNLIERATSKQVLSLISYSLILHDLQSEDPFRKLVDKDDQPIRMSAEQKQMAIALFEKKKQNMEILSSYNDDERELMELLDKVKYSPEDIAENLNVSRVKFTDFLSISYLSQKPKLSAFVVNTLTDELIRYEKSLRADRSTEALDFFASLLADKQAVYEEKTEALKAYKAANNVGDVALESSSKIAQKGSLELQREETISKIQSLNLTIRNLEGRIARMESKQDSEGSLAELNTKIAEIRGRIRTLRSAYIDGGSKDADLKSNIDALSARLDILNNQASQISTVKVEGATLPELKEQLTQAELDLQIAQSKLSTVSATIGTIQGDVKNYADKEGTISVMRQAVERAAEEYSDALNKYNQEKSKSLISGVGLKPVLRGQPAGEAEASKTLLKTGLAFGATLMLCVFGVIFIEFADLSVKTPAQFERMTKLELAGVINQIKMTNNKLNLGYIFSDDGNTGDLTTFKHLIRKVRYEIESDQAQSILITSTEDKVGKSFLIVCLAYSLSLIKKKVLIVDTNFRNNSLSKMLMPKQSNQKLLKKGDFDDVKLIPSKSGEPASEETEKDSRSIISKTAHRDIDIIGSISSTDSPLEILSGRNFKFLIEDLKLDYDYILMEGASINNYSDTMELAAFADKVLPVFSAESVIKQVDKESIKYLRTLNGQLIGSVLNKVKTKDMKS